MGKNVTAKQRGPAWILPSQIVITTLNFHYPTCRMKVLILIVSEIISKSFYMITSLWLYDSFIKDYNRIRHPMLHPNYTSSTRIRETDPERTQRTELVNKEAKITAINMLLCSRTQRKTWTRQEEKRKTWQWKLSNIKHRGKRDGNDGIEGQWTVGQHQAT